MFPLIIIQFSWSNTAAAVDTFEITSDSLAAFHASMDANFPFDTPLVVRALDDSGVVITDGPDANLVSWYMHSGSPLARKTWWWVQTTLVETETYSFSRSDSCHFFQSTLCKAFIFPCARL